MSRKSLYPAAEPMTINVQGLLFMCIVFAIVFAIIGVCTMHYPTNFGWV